MQSVGVENPYKVAQQAAEFVTAKFGGQHDVLAVLGSGWAHAASVLDAINEISVTEIPGFTKPSAIGHGGTLKSVKVGNSRVLLLTGRTHLYEGHGVNAVVHAVRTAWFAGCKTVVLTNAAGCLRQDWGVGATAVISDHINLTGFSPLTGADAPAPLHGRFVDLTDAYSLRLREIAKQVDQLCMKVCIWDITARTLKHPQKFVRPESGVPTWLACRPLWRQSLPDI